MYSGVIATVIGNISPAAKSEYIAPRPAELVAREHEARHHAEHDDADGRGDAGDRRVGDLAPERRAASARRRSCRTATGSGSPPGRRVICELRAEAAEDDVEHRARGTRAMNTQRDEVGDGAARTCWPGAAVPLARGAPGERSSLPSLLPFGERAGGVASQHEPLVDQGDDERDQEHDDGDGAAVAVVARALRPLATM